VKKERERERERGKKRKKEKEGKQGRQWYQEGVVKGRKRTIH